MCLRIIVDEPERLLEKGEAYGFEWNITRNAMAFRCCYVKVHKGHPWFGKGYDEIDADCHGGLTFAEPDKPCDKPGPDDGYWVGLDLAHCFDAPDPELMKLEKDQDRMEGWSSCFDGTIRTQQYAIAESVDLCRQAKEAAEATR